MTVGQPLHLHNSLGRRSEAFAPIGDVVGVYTCGPTVYGYPHVGNMRPYVFADTLRRVLRWKQLDVRHVVNITDVGHAVAETNLGDDKMEVAAARERRSVEDIAEHYTRAFFDDLAALNVLPAHENPRATAYVDRMIGFAEVLHARGYAYEIDAGLYFDTGRSAGYGELGLLDLEGQLEGARVEQISGRRNKADFALWRTEQPGQRRAMRWNSPWGWGAPGWHLECSVMSIALLGNHFDIHTGGIDHRALHHVNEIAQSEAYLDDGQRWVRWWMHNEFVQLNAQKISKSAGTATRLVDLMAGGFHPMAYRLFLLGGHYRAPLDFTDAALEAAQATLRRIAARVEALHPLVPVESVPAARAAAGDDSAALGFLDQLDEAVSADLNTPRALAVLQQALRAAELDEAGRRAVVSACDALLGLGLGELTVASLSAGRELPLAEIEQLVAERGAARAARDWALADKLRDRLEDLGIELMDSPAGTTWRSR